MFAYCRKCVAVRQFLPNINRYEDNDLHCDVCGNTR